MMRADEFVKRVWQAEHLLMVQNGGTRPQGWEVRIHPETRSDIFVDPTPWPMALRVEEGVFKVYDIPIVPDSAVPVGQIRMRIEVAA